MIGHLVRWCNRNTPQGVRAIGARRGVKEGEAVATSAEERRFRGQPAVCLSVGELSATFLPQLGMTGASMSWRGREHLALPGGLPALRAGSTLGLPLLAPWANRLACRHYRAAGVDVDLTGLRLHTDGNGLPIHGLLVGRPGWRVESLAGHGDEARLCAAIDVDDPAFPFPHRIDLAVIVSEHTLAVATTVTPTGARAVPIAFGWHPYLRLPGTPRRRWQLRLPARRHVALDARGIPTGPVVDEPREEAAIGTRTFDDLYAVGDERELALVADDAAVTLRLDDGYAFAQVWVPAGKPYAALEPMTSATNGLVDGSAPLVQPGDSRSARFGLVIDDV
jgi:galactose mutarotase-like enzyme